MDDTFASIKERFQRRCGSDLEWVRRGLIEPPELTNPKFQMMIHRLAGMAGTMGYHDLSRCAADLDDVLIVGGIPDLDHLQRLETALCEIAIPPGDGEEAS